MISRKLERGTTGNADSLVDESNEGICFDMHDHERVRNVVSVLVVVVKGVSIPRSSMSTALMKMNRMNHRDLPADDDVNKCTRHKLNDFLSRSLSERPSERRSHGGSAQTRFRS